MKTSSRSLEAFLAYETASRQRVAPPWLRGWGHTLKKKQEKMGMRMSHFISHHEIKGIMG
jgi:hypothetical protein